MIEYLLIFILFKVIVAESMYTYLTYKLRSYSMKDEDKNIVNFALVTSAVWLLLILLILMVTISVYDSRIVPCSMDRLNTTLAFIMFIASIVSIVSKALMLKHFRVGTPSIKLDNYETTITVAGIAVHAILTVFFIYRMSCMYRHGTGCFGSMAGEYQKANVENSQLVKTQEIAYDDDNVSVSGRSMTRTSVDPRTGMSKTERVSELNAAENGNGSVNSYNMNRNVESLSPPSR